MRDKSDQLDKWRDTVGGEFYEELLNRYERVLIYAGQLQEKLRNSKLLSERQNLLLEQNTSLEKENGRLKELLGVERQYVTVLEHALRSLGVLDEKAQEDVTQEPAGVDWPSA